MSLCYLQWNHNHVLWSWVTKQEGYILSLSVSLCVCLCVCVCICTCIWSACGVCACMSACPCQRLTLSIFFILLLNMELADLSGWLVSSRNPPASTLRLQVHAATAGFPNGWWRSEIMSLCFPRKPFPQHGAWLMEHYLYHPNSVAHIAHVDHKIATLRLPWQDTSDHCRIHTVFSANDSHRGLISQKIWPIYFSQPFRGTDSWNTHRRKYVAEWLRLRLRPVTENPKFKPLVAIS